MMIGWGEGDVARNVNISLSGWRATGTNVSTPQYEQTITADWIDNAGVAHTAAQTVRFPNILATLISAGHGAWVAAQINELLIAAARKSARVDD